MGWNDRCEIKELLGKTLAGIKKGAGGGDDDEIVFTCTDGAKYKMYHDQE